MGEREDQDEESANTSSDLSTNSNITDGQYVRINGTHSYKYLLTNARSLSQKIDSLHTAFIEHELDFALITESWLKDGQVLDKDIIDLEWGTDMKIIYKNRPRNPRGLRKVGGGVSVIYNKSRCSFRERKIRGNKYELVLAVGKVGTVPRQVAVFCMYLEPRMKVAEIADLCDIISREILMLKAKGDPIIILGGDINRKDISNAMSDFPDICQSNYAPTRGDACLDIAFSNEVNLNPTLWPPLETKEGIKSDHLCVIFSGKIERERNFHWVKKVARKHTEAALEEYGRRLQEADWDALLPPGSHPDQLVESFQEWNTRVTDELFPLKTIRCRSNEDPWITDGIRKLSKQKRRVYKRAGKSALWWRLDDRMQKLLADSKEEYVDNVSKPGTSAREYFTAVRNLGSAAKKAEWNMTDLFPGCSEAEVGEKAADYFTRITDLFTPLTPDRPQEDEKRRPITGEEVRKKLKEAKKPNSMVVGDVLPRVAKAHHEKLVVPVTTIFNAVFEHAVWPAAWKTETTVVIPKINNPESLADCRNLSCTPFLSKVLESILLEDMRAEIPEDLVQYGGIKASSVDHLMVDLLERVLSPLEDGCPSLVLGIDFEKAFNRLDHPKCIDQLRRLGASKPSIALTRSFLTGRSMRVKMGGILSRERLLNGGSPQGSILGCYLYCAATQRINLSIPYAPQPRGGEPHRDNSEDPIPPDESLLPGTQGEPEEDGGFDLLPIAEESYATSEDDSFHTASVASSGSHTMEIIYETLLAMFKYVDDTTIVERVLAGAGIRHISARNPTEQIPAEHLEAFLSALIEVAGEIGMKVNCGKTQLLCYTPDNGYRASAMINAGRTK